MTLDKIKINSDVKLGKKDMDQIAETATELGVYPPSKEAMLIMKDLLLMGFNKEYLDRAYRYWPAFNNDFSC